MEKIIKVAEVYSKVGRLFIKEQKKQVVEGLNKQMASSGKQLIRLKKDKISLRRNQLYESKISYREMISMEPVKCLSFTHCRPPPPQWEEGLRYLRCFHRYKASRGSSVWGCGFIGGGWGQKGGGHNRGRGDGSGH